MLKIIVVFIIGVCCSHSATSKIYKYTDENGVIHYSDTKPSEDTLEANIKPLSVVDIPTNNSNWKRAEHKTKQSATEFEQFELITPANGSNMWGTGGNVLATVNIDGKLNPKYRIKFFIDGTPRGKVKSNQQLIADISRGEHSIYAQVIDNNTRKVIKTTPTHTFYLMQPSKK